MVIHLLEAEQDDYMVIPAIAWEQFEAIATAFQDIPGVKLSYLDRCVEIMTTGDEHEDLKKTIAILLEAYMRAKGIRFYGRGAPTLGSREQGVRREPDESYNIGTKKGIPDFLIEVVITSGGLDKLESYKRIGIPEVWFWIDNELLVYQLQDRQYQPATHSQFLPDLDLVLLTQYISFEDQYDAVTEFLAAATRI
ncbi:MAG: Uma2 family endonuclease [Leptolyngbyaceae cyanobacterium RM1_406_9]|nr:Uma2 family endonuclease [Leptolyngbyaceae cyanobacterium RM1_406_9]